MDLFSAFNAGAALKLSTPMQFLLSSWLGENLEVQFATKSCSGTVENPKCFLSGRSREVVLSRFLVTSEAIPVTSHQRDCPDES